MATSPSIDELQKSHEAALDAFLKSYAAQAKLSGQGTDSDWALVRALVHRAVHLAADRKAGEYCAMATFLAEMIGHAHGLFHPGDRADASHGANVH
jgi:hypothetical protein